MELRLPRAPTAGLYIFTVPRLQAWALSYWFFPKWIPAQASPRPGEWVAPGAYINSVGYGGANAGELVTELLLKSRFFWHGNCLVIYIL